MKNYAAHMDNLLDEYRAHSRSTQQRFFIADARTTRAGSAAFDELRGQLAEQARQQEIETARELAARREREERDRLARLEIERARLAEERARPATYSRNAIVQPTDWTDEDDALEAGAPISWLS
ncbi:hypothetical protein [Nocardia jiangxiensis]|uniref:Uncharacterized protein n=1 Tax=Nocardia jiangxiensis TaxID=282685 RepID=A0ABW6RVD9_9NOCA|nr:hypothetical protein [Nocardia jiangxiensis]